MILHYADNGGLLGQRDWHGHRIKAAGFLSLLSWYNEIIKKWNFK